MAVTKTLSQARSRRQLGLECLESRTLMAGDVTVSYDSVSDLLRVIGDNAANVVQIEQRGRGELAVLGKSGTSINGQINGRFTAAVVDQLFVDLKGGDDRLTIDRAGVQPASVRVVDVLLGAGNDQATVRLSADHLRLHASLGTPEQDDYNLVSIEGKAVHRSANFKNLTVSGRGQIKANNLVAVDASFSVEGELEIERAVFRRSLSCYGSDAADLITLRNVQVQQRGLLPRLVIKTDGGNDTVQMNNILLDTIATIDTGTGHDRVSILNVATSQQLAVNLGAGNDRLTIGTVKPAQANFHGESGVDTFFSLDSLPQANDPIKLLGFERFGATTMFLGGSLSTARPSTGVGLSL